jgi:hypothetical protein
MIYKMKNEAGVDEIRTDSGPLPEGAKELTEEEYAALTQATDPIQLTPAELAAAARRERDVRLAACDWTQARDVPDALSAKWQPYRQALRDISKQAGFPAVIDWPEAP